MSGVMTMDNQTTVKATPQHRFPQTAIPYTASAYSNSSLTCCDLHHPQHFLIGQQSIMGPGLSTSFNPVLPVWCMCVTSPPLGLQLGQSRRLPLICTMGWNWIKYNNVQVVQSIIYSTSIGVSVITNLMNWTLKGILHIHPLTTPWRHWCMLLMHNVHDYSSWNTKSKWPRKPSYIKYDISKLHICLM